MAFRFICYGKSEQNFEITCANGLIGSKNSSFLKHLRKGDTVFFYLKSSLFASAQISSEGFESSERIWPNQTYPYRYKIDSILRPKEPVPFLSSSPHNELKTRFGKGWGYKFLYSPTEIPLDVAEEVVALLKAGARIK